VEFNGEEKLLRFDFNAMADLEDHFDKGIASILDKNRMGFSTIRGLYWAGLKWKMPGLTMEKVGTMLSDKMADEDISIPELMDPIKKGIEAGGWIKKSKKSKKAEETEAENEEKN
jgi:hypothetical protein